MEQKTNQVEGKRRRELEVKFSALKAKRDYIDKNYDYKQNVKSINTETLRQMLKSNQIVSSRVYDFSNVLLQVNNTM